MKEFLKYTFATITGIVIFITAMVILATITICGIALVTKDSGAVHPADNSVLVVKLSGDIVEHAEEDVFGALFGEDNAIQQGVDEIVTAIDKASQCDKVKALYLEAGMMNADFASLQEIRNAVERFKAGKKGKFVVSYGDEYTQGAYYVCSAADKIWINPQGMVDLHGIAAQPMYLKGLLEKIGVKMTVVKVGKYKSATEQYTESQMSEENREQVTRYVNNIWKVVTADISKGRKISADSINSYADQLATLQDTQWLKEKAKLVDQTMYADEAKTFLKKMLGMDADEMIKQISCKEMCAYDSDNDNATYLGHSKAFDKIAVYYCEGSIVQNEASGMIMGDAGIVSKKMIADLNKLAENENIKAVVIRINSGGGDAFASEDIWHAVKALKAKKPVVISMGGMAASGAYYLSADASWIVAQPTTLTGSIGIFGCFPDMSGLLQDKLGLKYDNVKTNKHADMDFAQAARPFNAEEQIMLQRYINRGYELFCKRVADGRKIAIDSVKVIAEGRVWTGTDALRIGLVDQLGGMPEAIKKAAALARLEDYSIEQYPVYGDWMEQLLTHATGNGNNLDEELRATLGTFYEPFCIARGIQKQSPVQARCEWVLEVKGR